MKAAWSWRVPFVVIGLGLALVACGASMPKAATPAKHCPARYEDIAPKFSEPSSQSGTGALQLPNFNQAVLCVYRGQTGTKQRQVTLSAQLIPALRRTLDAATYTAHSTCAAPSAKFPNVVALLSSNGSQVDVVSIELSGCRFMASQGGRANVSEAVSSTVLGAIGGLSSQQA